MAHALRISLRPRPDVFRIAHSTPPSSRNLCCELSQSSWEWPNQPWKIATGKPLSKHQRLSPPCLASHDFRALSFERRGFLWRLALFRGVKNEGPAGECHGEFKQFQVEEVGGLLKTVKAACSAAMEYLYRGGAGGNEALVEFLQRNGMLKSQRVAHAMKEVDRGLFVPDGQHAYVDSPQPIGHNATISAPHMHACCLDLLESHLQPGMKCLDVGSGTGYLTAVMGILVGEAGRAFGVEHIPELVDKSRQDVGQSKAGHLLERGVISLHVGDGRLGWPSEAPYDAVHVGAAASTVPQVKKDAAVHLRAEAVLLPLCFDLPLLLLR